MDSCDSGEAVDPREHSNKPSACTKALLQAVSHDSVDSVTRNWLDGWGPFSGRARDLFLHRV